MTPSPAPNPIDLTTVAAVKAWLSSNGLPPANTNDDPNIQACITDFSNMFLWRTGMGPQDGTQPLQSLFLGPVQFTETYDGNGSIRMFLDHRPIQSVLSLVVGNRTYNASTGWGNTGYVIDGSKASISLRGGGSNSYLTYDIGQQYGFFEAPQNVFVTYIAGYGSPILSSSALVGGSGYVVNDTFTVSNILGTNLATGVVDSVDGSGAVLTYTIVFAGNGYNVGAYATVATSGVGTGLILVVQTAPPSDIALKAQKSCALQYTRKDYIGLKSTSLAQGAGTTSYQDWEEDPDVARLISNYSRWYYS